MTVFIHEPDGADEPTIWVLEGGDTDNYRYTHLFSRIDLDPDSRRFWPDVVARMSGTTEHMVPDPMDGAQVECWKLLRREEQQANDYHKRLDEADRLIATLNEQLRMAGTTIITADDATVAVVTARRDAAETFRNAGEVGVMTREIDGRTWFALETPEHDAAPAEGQREVTEFWTQKFLDACAEIRRLRNTPCFECGHS